MKIKGQYRQGDVLLVSCQKPNEKLTAVTPKNGRVILAYGETSGHMHSIADEHCQAFVDDTGVTWLECKQAVDLLHHDQSLQPTHDHDAIVRINTGWVRVVPQCEYSPEEIRRVAD